MNDKEMIIINSMVDTPNDCVECLEKDEDILINLQNKVKEVQEEVYSVTSYDLCINVHLIDKLSFWYLSKKFGYNNKILGFVNYYGLDYETQGKLIEQIDSIVNDLRYSYSSIDSFVDDMKKVISKLKNLK